MYKLAKWCYITFNCGLNEKMEPLWSKIASMYMVYMEYDIQT